MQTERGIGQARAAGKRIKELLAIDEEEIKLYFYMSPYRRSQQTFEALASNFSRDQVQGCQEEVQLREQDFGNFQVTFAPLEIAVSRALIPEDARIHVQPASMKMHCYRCATLISTSYTVAGC